VDSQNGRVMTPTVEPTPSAPSPSSQGRRKKVLCVTSYLLGDNAASWRVMNIASSLRDQGYAVAINQYVRRPSPPTNDHPGNTYCEIPSTVVVSSRPVCLLRHLRYLARGNYDLVIGNNINGALFSLLGRIRRPLVLDMHGDMVAELEMDRPGNLERQTFIPHARRLLYRAADYVTCRLSSSISCVSRTMMRVLSARGIREEKLVYAPNCVDLEFFHPSSDGNVSFLKDELGIEPDRMLVGYVGRFQRWQGVECFVEAARSVGDPEIAFLVVGGNETRREGNLHFLHQVPVSQVPKYYGICDVLVLPRPLHTATEVAAPTKFAEYAAMGKPILASDVGDAGDLIRKYQCGVVVENNKPASLREGIIQLKNLSSETLAHMGRAARSLAENEFDPRITAMNLSRCIEELTGSDSNHDKEQPLQRLL
jgi:glycosyltransferase involved in cell wall biosynthesis